MTEKTTTRKPKANSAAKDIKDETVVATATVDETVASEATANEDAVTEEIFGEAKESNEEDIHTVLSDITKLSGNMDSSDDTGVRVMQNKFSATDKIPCKSLFHGKLVYTSPTNGAKWAWNEYGAIQHVPMGELEAMNNHKPVFLNKPLIVILESSVVEDFNFGDVYRKIASFNKLGKMLATGKSDEIRAMVRNLIAVGMRDSVIAEVRKSRKENTLVDINVINMLNTELKTDIG